MAIWENKYIKPNQYSRPQLKLLGVKKVIVHYTANNGATALNHYNYFNNLTGRYASAHIFTDKQEALCILPLDEVAYHANDRECKIPELKASVSYYRGGNANLNTVGVEMCLEKDGTFHPDTIARTEDVVVELCKIFNLNPIQDVLMHYHVTGKNCPAPWVRQPQLFIDFKNRVKNKMNNEIKIISEEEDIMSAKLDPSIHALNKAVQGVLLSFEQDKEHPLSDEWRKKFESGLLTETEGFDMSR